METLLYGSSLAGVGRFSCRPLEYEFKNSGPAGSDIIVFPRTSVVITYAGREPVVAGPNLVMFYNKGQEYQREKVSEAGDICVWIAFDKEVLIDALAQYDRRVEDRPHRPFPFSHGPSDANTYLLQQLIVQHICESERSDPLFVDELLMKVLDDTIENQYSIREQKRRSTFHNPDHIEITREAQRLIATRFPEPLTLEVLGAALNCSPFHLARIFRRQTGSTIHRYLEQTRLRVGLSEITSGPIDLTELAFTLGYSSHSHFTRSFKRTFGRPPSKLRGSLDSFEIKSHL